MSDPLTQADWSIIATRLERAGRDIAVLAARVVQAQETANRADQRSSAHQPFIDRLVGTREQAPSGQNDVHIDGRTLMVMARWCQAVLDIPHFGTIAIAPDQSEQKELRSAVQNTKYAMEHMKLSVVDGAES